MTLQGKRVLLVEDEPLICMMIEDFLSDLGCEVVATAAQLEDALLKATSLAMDVAVLDMNLRGQLSYPVGHVLNTRKIPFMFSTGYGVAALPQELKNIAVLSKPFGLQQLEQSLHLVMAS